MKRILLHSLLIMIFSSCEKILFQPDEADKDPYKNFDHLWNEVNKKYSYFELKNIDWEKIRITYRSLLNENMSEEKLFNALAAMLNELRDDHSNLIAPFNISRYNLPLKKKKNFNQRTVEEFYIPNFKITGPFIHDFIGNNEIAYIRYGSFLAEVKESTMDYIFNHYKNTKGIILDLRENGGGNTRNISLILERFSETRTHVGYSVIRNGPGKNNFTSKQPLYIEKSGGIKYSKPVIVLTDRGSFSASTVFALFTKAYSQIRLMGDTTGGGGGLPNGGQLPNGWIYRFSVSQILDLNGNNYAENGVPPEFYVEFDWSDLTKDEIIEEAIKQLK